MPTAFSRDSLIVRLYMQRFAQAGTNQDSFSLQEQYASSLDVCKISKTLHLKALTPLEPQLFVPSLPCHLSQEISLQFPLPALMGTGDIKQVGRKVGQHLNQQEPQRTWITKLLLDKHVLSYWPNTAFWLLFLISCTVVPHIRQREDLSLHHHSAAIHG